MRGSEEGCERLQSSPLDSDSGALTSVRWKQKEGEDIMGVFGGKEMKILGLKIKQKGEKILKHRSINDLTNGLQELERHFKKAGVWVLNILVLAHRELGLCWVWASACFSNHNCNLSRILIKLDVTAKQNVLFISGSKAEIS